MKRSINAVFDKFVHPQFSLFGRTWSCFQVCGVTGLVLALALMFTLVARAGLSAPIMIVVVVAGVAACLGLVMVTKIILGEERLTYCHHEIVSLSALALLLWLLGQPALRYLDIVVLGWGVGLMCGRVGCLLAGCCHGRPSGCGVHYGAEHVAVGFSPYFGLTRFFPIQIVEAMWVGGIVVAGCFVLGSYPPGTVLSLYICAYGAGRFFLEFLRADTDRIYLWGFSESQWLSLMLMTAVVLGEIFGMLPFHWWHVAATGLVSLTMLAVAIKRRLHAETNYRILLPRHIEEIAQALDSTSNHADNNGFRQHALRSRIAIDCTSLGVQISAGRIIVAGRHLYHYAFSNKAANMTEARAKTLARLIVQLRHPAGSSNLIAGNGGVFHLLVSAP